MSEFEQPGDEPSRGEAASGRRDALGERRDAWSADRGAAARAQIAERGPHGRRETASLETIGGGSPLLPSGPEMRLLFQAADDSWRSERDGLLTAYEAKKKDVLIAIAQMAESAKS